MKILILAGIFLSSISSLMLAFIVRSQYDKDLGCIIFKETARKKLCWIIFAFIIGAIIQLIGNGFLLFHK